MISYIKGEITFNEGDTLVVENNGIGYEITVPTFSAQKLLSKGGEVTVYTYMSVREDGISLFGFESREEKAFYQKLISVSGIGPKAAISILSSITPSELVTAVLSSDAAAIAKAPGVGKKTAQRVMSLRTKSEAAILRKCLTWARIFRLHLRQPVMTGQKRQRLLLHSDIREARL